MANKKVKIKVKMLIKAGSANPAPPVGSVLGPHGLNLVMFCKEFNERTVGMQGMVPALITIFDDRSYEFILKTPPVAELIKQAIGISSGASNPLKETSGTITEAQIMDISAKKLEDLNCITVDAAARQVRGTCRSMGVRVAN